MANRTVFVELLDEGVQVWRPVEAEEVSEESYRLVAPEGYDADLETWAIGPA